MAHRRSFTVKEKTEIISRLKNGENNAALCKEFKVSHSTISSMWKNRDVILECFVTKSSKMKKNRKPIHQDVENALLEWFKDQKDQNIMITGRILQEKANYFAKMFGKVDFACSERWIYRFRQRHDISVGKVCGAARVSRNECDSWLKSIKLQDSVNNMKTAWLEKVPVSELKTNSDFEHLINQVREDNTNQEALQSTKTVSYCCFCREVKNEFFNVIDKPYVELKKTTLTLNDLSIELDFNKDSTKKTICENCDTKLKEIHDYLKLVKNAQDKLRHVTEDDDFLSLALYIKNEGSLNNDSKYSDGNVDGNNKEREDHEDRTKDYISKTEFVKEIGTTHKRRNNKQTTSYLKKKGRFSFNSDSRSLPLLYNDNDESETDTEIEYEVDNKNEIDPFRVTDIESARASSAAKSHVSTEFTKYLQEDNRTIDIKEETVEITDDSDKEVQKQDAVTKVIQFEVQQDTEDLASNVCKEVERMDILASQINVKRKMGSRSDIVHE